MFYGKILSISDLGSTFLVSLKAPKGQVHNFNVPRRGMPSKARIGINAIIDADRAELRVP